MDPSAFYVDTVTVFRRSGTAAGTKGDPTFDGGVELACRVESVRTRIAEGIGAVGAGSVLLCTDKPTAEAAGLVDIQEDDVIALEGQDVSTGMVVVAVEKQRTRDGSFESWEITLS
jgi:hypothetical protein